MADTSDLLSRATFVLKAPSPPAWINAVCDDFDAFLLDHAAAERKASAMAVSFVVQYPDKYPIHEPMIRIAREELLHYQQVMKLIHQRELLWERDEKDPYIRALLAHLSTDRKTRLLDRLLMGGIVEARGVERFGLVAAHQTDPELARFYDRLSESERNHADTFTQLASHFFPTDQIAARLEQWLEWEVNAMMQTPIRAALH